ncbi:L,D-transpeptidase family protein [Salaquimonas pukyongi]|uniref:L,D-transpeptidase family protein n=1 Tax=Salaquimonas pukyongi TaxID=2712698 RepID=UPI00096BB664|nr:L,D-transpeptidase family protein [Salaquimonas pukyongi]
MKRREFLGGATALLGASALSGTMAGTEARAESVIDRILKNPGHGSWNDQFDAQASGVALNSSKSPIFSEQTPFHIERAIGEYRGIVGNGGWPVVPANQKLKLGATSRNVPLLRQRLAISGDLDRAAGSSEVYDTWVTAAVKRFQARHGLPADGVLGRFTYAAMNIPASTRLGQLETNLVRLRAMSGFLGQRYVMVNIPAAHIEAVENGEVVSRHTAIVGKVDRQSPILNSKIHEINLNPYWTAPVSIVKKDIIPLMQKDPTYLTRNAIRIFAPDGTEIPPQSIDWNSEQAVDYMFRQDPGRINAMGSVKINFPNPHAVYMHDTPQQSLFGKLLRFESSGCVRVQNVRDLVAWLVKDTPGWSRREIERVIESGERIDVALAEPVPVYFTYVTAWATETGVVQFRDDIYRRDGVEELALGTGTTL